MVTIDEFRKLELRIARILEANNHPDADKLYVLKIDLGTETRQIVAGIRLSYEAKDLVGKEVVVVVNLEPAVIRGVESAGMLLATHDEKGISMLSPDREVVLGSSVR
jgi:methionyl-tRNA synthetase